MGHRSMFKCISSNTYACLWNQASVGPTLSGYQISLATEIAPTTERMKIDYNGNININNALSVSGGININNNGVLNFDSQINNFRINLWGGLYGFGINGSMLRYNSDSRHTFCSGGNQRVDFDASGNITCTGSISSNGHTTSTLSCSQFLNSSIQVADGTKFWCLDGYHFIYFNRPNNILQFQEFGNINFTIGGGQTQIFQINSSGVVVSSGSYQGSDKKLKTNIRKIENAVSIINQLRGVHFTWIENKNDSMGFIAQEIEKILPQVIHTCDDGTKAVSYISLIGLLVEGIKEQQEQINNMQNQINLLLQNK